MLSSLAFSNVFQLGIDIATSISIISAASMFIYNQRRETKKNLHIRYLETLKETIDNFKKVSSELLEYYAQYEEVAKLANWFEEERELVKTKYSPLHKMAKGQKFYFLMTRNFEFATTLSDKIYSLFKNKKLILLKNELAEFQEYLYEIYTKLARALNDKDLEEFEKVYIEYLKAANTIHVGLNKIYFDFLKSL